MIGENTELDAEKAQTVKLSSLTTGQAGIIVKVQGYGAFRKRITEMGFVRGQKITVIKRAPMLDPVEYGIMGYQVALRRSEAEQIEVTLCVGEQPAEEKQGYGQNQLEDSDAESRRTRPSDADCGCPGTTQNTFRQAARTINVALVGNPNIGKTSLFNEASGSHQKVGNYSGVTVDVKTATVRHKGYTIHMSDLPGTYSLTEYSPEEVFVRRHLSEQMPDVVINVVDATNLERNLFLTTSLIDMDVRAVIALNMYDELLKSDKVFDYQTLGSMIGIPIVPTTAREGRGIGDLLDKVIDVFEEKDPTVRHVHINYGKDVEVAIRDLQKLLRKDKDLITRYSPRDLSLRLLEKEKTAYRTVEKCPEFVEIDRTARSSAKDLETTYGENVETVIADAKYGFIAGALSETLSTKEGAPRKSRDIDALITNKWLGFPIFLAIMLAMFQATFTLGGYPAEWLEAGVAALGEFVNSVMPESSLRALLVDGIINGVGGVLVFLPNILILFFFIALMEDTGYMARAAFIMDRMMHKIGLHGKSFIPLLMGFGCNVPAIIATRTLESRKDRLLTMLIIPFTSCSARLPVYVLLIGAFFPQHSGLVLFAVYMTGIAVAVLSSLVLKKLFFRREEAPFVMELPPYRIPTFVSVVRHMWDRGVQYLKKMGSIILLASVVIWALGHYPEHVEYSRDYEAMKEQVAVSQASEEVKTEELARLEVEQAAEKQEKSYIGRLGKTIEPAIAPLGFDWQIGISLITGFAAKEIVVSTMSVLSSTEGDTQTLGERLKEQTYTYGPKAGEPVYTPLVAFTMMIFILLYFPCIAAIAAIGRESGSWKWAVFTALYTTGMAWIVSFAVYQIGLLIT